MTQRNPRRTTIVAGGTSGIGFSIVKRFLHLGYRVATFGHREYAADAARSALAAYVASGDALIECVDVRSQSEIHSFCNLVDTTWQHPDTLVYCAGISPKTASGRASPFVAIDLDEWNEVIATNLTGAMLCSQAVVGNMAKCGFGRIVLIGSLAGRTRPSIAGPAYAASKAGLAGLSRAMVNEFASAGVTVNVVAPGRIITPMSGERASHTNLDALKRIPAGRPGEPDEVAAIVAFLVSEEAGFVNGAVVDINGGEYVPA